jgi:eukaryotic-like serine/threonine-protein kinase
LKQGDVIERYRLIEPLGEGGMGTVWLVEHVTLRGRHALKVLDRHLLADAGIRERFLEEGRIQSSLVHPAIVRVTDVVTDGVAGLVMDYVDGPDLGDWLVDRGPISEADAKVILSTLLGAVGLAHDRGIVHRDLKPGNVLMRGGALSPVLVDFGIAKVVAQGGSRTRTGTSMGTPGYMAPEQVRDASKEPSLNSRSVQGA